MMTVNPWSRFRRPLATVTGMAATLLLVAGMPAQAQTAPKTAADSSTLEEVLVTAEKRTENLQVVPISVSALTAAMAEKIGVVNGQTLAQVVPGLLLNRQTNGTQAFLRGVGTSSTQAGNEPAVAMYVDDVYYGSSAVALTNYTSVDHIEVLKGPQGTLFGRNATGGVIQVFTKEPEAQSSAKVTLGYASFNTLAGSIYATGSLASNVIANINLYNEDQRGGWGHNYTTGNPTYLAHDRGGRAKLQFNISDRTTLKLSGDYDDYFNQQAVYFRPAPGTFSAAKVAGVPVSIPPPNVYDTIEVIDPEASVKQYGGSAKLTHDFGALEFKSVTAYRHDKAIQRFAQDGSSIFRQIPTLQYNSDTTSQEFQLLSPAGSKLKWVAGAFFMHDKTTVLPFTFVGSGAGGVAPNFLTALGLDSKQLTDSYSGFVQGSYPVADKLNVTAGLRYTNDKRSITGGRINTNAAGVQTPHIAALNDGFEKSWSSVTARLALDYRITDDVMVYVGYNKGFKSGLFNSVLTPGGSSPAGTTFTAAQLTCNGTTYSYPTTTVAQPAPPCHDPPVDPENIKAYSLGMKAEFLDHRLRINTEAYLYKYTGLQLQAVTAVPGTILTTTRLTNAAAATMKGIDFDITYKPVSRLTLNFNGQFEDGKYDDFPNGQFFVTNPAGGNCAFTVGAAITAANPLGGCPFNTIAPPNYVPNANPALTGSYNLKGNKTVQTPPFVANMTVSYDQPISSGNLSYTAMYSHNGNYWAEASNGQGQFCSTTAPAPVSCSNPFNERQHAVNILNASVQWTSTDEKYNLRLWGKNITAEKYWVFANSTASITKNVPAPPRTYGVTLQANF
jgi:iron complex outermembrane receptor protein